MQTFRLSHGANEISYRPDEQNHGEENTMKWAIDKQKTVNVHYDVKEIRELRSKREQKRARDAEWPLNEKVYINM